MVAAADENDLDHYQQPMKTRAQFEKDFDADDHPMMNDLAAAAVAAALAGGGSDTDCAGAAAAVDDVEAGEDPDAVRTVEKNAGCCC